MQGGGGGGRWVNAAVMNAQPVVNVAPNVCVGSVTEAEAAAHEPLVTLAA